MLRGIDISSHQPQINWPVVAAAGNTFAVVKCTGGDSYANPIYHDQIAGARAAGLIVGHYHFAHEGENPGPGPGAEAAYFLAHADVQPGEFVALDIEDTGVTGDLSGWALTWLDTVEQALGFPPFIYSFPDYIKTRNLGTLALAAYPLWYARYWSPYATQPQPQVPGNWPKITIWQWSGGTHVAGIPNDTDENLFDGDRAALVALGKPGLAPPPPATSIVTPASDWGPGSKGRIVHRAETIIVINDDETPPKTYLGIRIDGNQLPWQEVK